MDHAEDREGQKRWASEFTLDVAVGMAFRCLYCGVPMFATKMPASSSPVHVGVSRPELYFRARPGPGMHLEGCDFEPKVVAALIEERTTRTRSGVSGATPSRIDLDRETVRKIGRLDADGDGEPSRVKRRRHADQGGPKPRRGPRATTLSHIQQACIAFTTVTDVASKSLVVEKYLPEECDTYGKVFRSLRDPMDHRAATRIWYATLIFRSAPVYGEPVLKLSTFSGDVDIDRAGWLPAVRRRFDGEIRILLDEAKRSWRSHRGGEPLLEPTIFVLAERSHRSEIIRVSEVARICVLLVARGLIGR